MPTGDIEFETEAEGITKRRNRQHPAPLSHPKNADFTEIHLHESFYDRLSSETNATIER